MILCEVLYYNTMKLMVAKMLLSKMCSSYIGSCVLRVSFPFSLLDDFVV